MAPSADGPGTTAGETLWLALLSAAHSPLAARVWQEKTQAHELWSHISRGSAGISLGASLVILAMQLPGGIAPAVGLGDALPAALIVSMAGVAA